MFFYFALFFVDQLLCIWLISRDALMVYVFPFDLRKGHRIFVGWVFFAKKGSGSQFINTVMCLGRVWVEFGCIWDVFGMSFYLYLFALFFMNGHHMSAFCHSQGPYDSGIPRPI